MTAIVSVVGRARLRYQETSFTSDECSWPSCTSWPEWTVRPFSQLKVGLNECRRLNLLVGSSGLVNIPHPVMCSESVDIFRNAEPRRYL